MSLCLDATLLASLVSFAITQFEDTPFQNAANMGHIEVCMLLLDKGAVFNAVSQVRKWCVCE